MLNVRGSLDARLLAEYPDGIPHDTMTPAEARRFVAAERAEMGFKFNFSPILTPPEGNTKLAKGKGYKPYGISLAPHRVAGVGTTCVKSTPECRAHCLNYSGKGGMPVVVGGRAWRTRLLARHPEAFATVLRAEMTAAHNKCVKNGDRLAFRFNVFSDLTAERLFPWAFEMFPDAKFYDYTKRWDRPTSDTYHLTYSVTERTTDAQIAERVGAGANVAMAVRGFGRKQPLPTTWQGFDVVDGDETDYRFLDPRGVVVMLRAKGTLGRSTSPFARDL